MKQFVASLVLVGCVTAAVLSPTTVCHAAEVYDTPGSIETIQPRYAYTSYVYANMGKDSGGNASCTAVVRGKSTATKISGYMYLEQYKNGRWTPYDSWYDSADGNALDMTESCSVEAGYKYRVRFSGTVYSGRNSEPVSTTSATQQF